MDQRPGELDDTNKDVTTGGDKMEGEALTVRSETAVDAADRDEAANADLTTEEPEEILEQIEQTRSSMSETIDAIQEKLSFANISEQVKENVSEHISSAVETAKDAVFGATFKKAENFMQTVTRGLSDLTESAGDAGTQVVETAKRNPVPFALIGLGVGLLLFQNNKSKTVKRNFRYENDTDYTSYSSSRASSRSSKTMLSQAGKSVSGALGSAKDTVGGVAGSAYEGVSSAASSAASGVTGAASSAYEGASSLVSSTGKQATEVARKVQRQYEDTLEENPLAIGAVALALGAVVGLAIPVTEYENQWMGETKDNLVNQVQDAARGAIERVQEVAGEVTKQVKDQAQTQGGAA